MARQDPLGDQHLGPRGPVANKLTDLERRRLLRIATSTAYRDLSPAQIVPTLADKGIYYASESTFYRILRENKLLEHRGKTKPPASRRPRAYVATRPNQVYCWDITYLKTAIRGEYFICIY